MKNCLSSHGVHEMVLWYGKKARVLVDPILSMATATRAIQRLLPATVHTYRGTSLIRNSHPP